MATKPKPKVAVKRVAKSSPKKATKSKVSTKARAQKAAKKASKRGRKLVDRARKGLGSVNRDTTTRRTARLTLSVVNFQKTTFDNTIDVIGKVQDQSGKVMRELLKNQGWVPGEGREVVDEWIKTTTKARNDFKKSTDKSFDLVTKFVKRLEKQQLSKPAAKAGAKKAAAKPRKKAAKKAPKKAAARRSVKSKAKK